MGFANEKSLAHATVFAEYIQSELKKSGADLSNTTRQTDNGAEYIGSWNAKENKSPWQLAQGKLPNIKKAVPMIQVVDLDTLLGAKIDKKFDFCHSGVYDVYSVPYIYSPVTV